MADDEFPQQEVLPAEPTAHERQISNLAPGWKPGQSGNPKGRPPGARSRFSETVIKAFTDDFEKHGAKTLARLRDKSPRDYIKMAVTIIPLQVQVKVSHVEEMDDAQLTDLIHRLSSDLRQHGIETPIGGSADGAKTAGGSELVAALPAVSEAAPVPPAGRET